MAVFRFGYDKTTLLVLFVLSALHLIRHELNGLRAFGSLLGQ